MIMKSIDSLLAEFEREAQTTRKHLERLPAESMDWRPHEKSYTAGGLASHIVACLSMADSIFNQDELDIDPASFKPYQAGSVADLLDTFDGKVAQCREILGNANDESLMVPW